MKRLRQWALAPALLPLLFDQPKPASAESPYLAPVLKDENGKIVGPLVSVDRDLLAIKLEPNEPLVSVYFYKPSRLYDGYGGLGGEVGYTTSDCTGTPYMDKQGELPVLTAGSVAYSSLFYPDPRATPALRHMGSFRNFSDCNITHQLVFRHAVQARGPVLVSAGTPDSIDLVPTAASGRPYIVDSTGKVLGPYFDSTYSNSGYQTTTNTTVLRLKPTNAVVAISVEKRGFVPTGYFHSYLKLYTSKDCTGQAYVDPRYDDAKPVMEAYVDPAHKQMIVYPSAPRTLIRVGSSQVVGEKCQPSRYHDQASVLLLASVRIDDQGFTPPFSVKIQ